MTVQGYRLLHGIAPLVLAPTVDMDSVSRTTDRVSATKPRAQQERPASRSTSTLALAATYDLRVAAHHHARAQPVQALSQASAGTPAGVS